MISPLDVLGAPNVYEILVNIKVPHLYKQIWGVMKT